MNFGGRKTPNIADGQRSKTHGADGDACQSEDLVAHASENAADFAVLPLAQNHLQNRTVLVMRSNRHSFGPGEPFRQMHALFELQEHVARRTAGHDDAIGFADAVARMRQPIGQCPVVRDQDQTVAMQVEPADGEAVRAFANRVRERAGAALPGLEEER